MSMYSKNAKPKIIKTMILSKCVIKEKVAIVTTIWFASLQSLTSAGIAIAPVAPTTSESPLCKTPSRK